MIGSAEWVSYKANLVRNGGDVNQPIEGSLDIKVKDLLDVSSNYNSLKRAGKGWVLVSLPKLPRKVKLESTYNLAAPRLDLDNVIFYDFEKDNAKKIVLNTKNKYSKTSLDSKNTLELGGEKYVVNVDGSRSGESFNNGEIKGKALVRLPSQRELTAELNRKMYIKATPIEGTITAKITDTLGPAAGKKTRSLSHTGTIKNGDLKERLFDLVVGVEFKDFEGKNVLVNAAFTHLPKGHFKSGSAAITVSGALVPNTFDVLVSVDEYCPIHAVYKVSAKYGGTVNFNVDGNFHVGERGVKPTSYALSANAAIPQSKLKSVTLSTSGSLLRPAVSDANSQYDVKFEIKGGVNDKQLALNTQGKLGASKGNIDASLNLPDIAPVTVDLSYARSGDDSSENRHAEGSVTVNYGNGKLVKFTGNVDSEKNRKVKIQASLQTPYEKAKSSDLSFETAVSNIPKHF